MRNLLPFALPTNAAGLIILVVALIILWIVISVPVYFSAKLVTEGKAHFGEALGATLLGAIVYYIVLIVVTFFLSAIMGYTAAFIGFFLAILAWLAVYKGEFQTGWIRALGIVLVAWAILFIMNGVFVAFFGVTVPKFYPF